MKAYSQKALFAHHIWGRLEGQAGHGWERRDGGSSTGIGLRSLTKPGDGERSRKNCCRLWGDCLPWLPIEEQPDLDIVAEEMYRDDEGLFKEVAVGLLILSSPCLVFATKIWSSTFDLGPPPIHSAWLLGVWIGLGQEK